MASGEARGFHRDLELIASSGTVTGLTDAELVGRFLKGKGDASEAAFEAIVAKHGPMVLSVCRGVLRRSSEADDAFQATFLVLVKKAGSVKLEASLAPWLYHVARRVAMKARSAAWKRGTRETTGVDVDPVSHSEIENSLLDAVPLLYDELDRLPEKYRFPVVLCHLEGLSHEEAARQLDWPVGTLSGRLSRARDLLRTRLTRRGLGVAPAFVSGTFSLVKVSTVPPALLRSTTLSASALASGGIVSTSILVLMQGALTAMFVSKLKAAGFAVAFVFLIATAGTYVLGQSEGEKPEPPKSAPATKPASNPSNITPRADQNLLPRMRPENLPEIPGFPKMSEMRRNPRPFRQDMAARPQENPSTVYGYEIISVQSKDNRSISAMVIDVGTWDTYQAQEGVHIFPISSNNVMALAVSGDDIRELAAISTPNQGNAGPRDYGKFIRHKLEKPVKGEIYPQVGPAMACYQIGNDVHAFSGATNSWASLATEGTEPPKVTQAPKAIIVEQGDKVYVFGLNTGKWSEGLKVPKADDPKPKDQ